MTDKRTQAFVDRGVTPQMIQDIDKDGNGSVNKFEFVTYMLIGQVRYQHGVSTPPSLACVLPLPRRLPPRQKVNSTPSHPEPYPSNKLE